MNKLSTAFFSANADEAAFKQFDPTENLVKSTSAEPEDRGRVAGYASVFNNVDAGGDIVRPGAFKKSLSERKVKMLFNHDPNKVIGKMTEAYEDSYGLYAVFSMNLQTPLGRETYDLVKAGDLDGFSIGYATIKGENIRHKNGRQGRELKEVSLWEVSVVTFPMNELALITQVKNSFEELTSGASVSQLEAIKSADDIDAIIAALNEIKAMRDQPIIDVLAGLKAIKDEKQSQHDAVLQALRDLKGL